MLMSNRLKESGTKTAMSRQSHKIRCGVVSTPASYLGGAMFKYRSRVSSGSIVSDYGLDDRAIGVRSPAGAKDFSSSLCPDPLWGPPSLLYNGYRGSFPRG
jgi:hypothetical protein